MTDDATDSELGIPPKELWFVRQVYIPFSFYWMDWRRARELFKEETARIFSLCRKMQVDELNHLVPVKRLIGMRETSRNWSPGMILDHLNKFNSVAAQIIPALHANKTLTMSFSLEDMQPSMGHNLDTLHKFDQIGKLFGETEFTNYMLREPSVLQFKHPWLGALDQQQWMKVAALHQRMHRKQLELAIAPTKS